MLKVHVREPQQRPGCHAKSSSFDLGVFIVDWGIFTADLGVFLVDLGISIVDKGIFVVDLGTCEAIGAFLNLDRGSDCGVLPREVLRSRLVSSAVPRRALPRRLPPHIGQQEREKIETDCQNRL